MVHRAVPESGTRGDRGAASSAVLATLVLLATAAEVDAANEPPLGSVVAVLEHAWPGPGTFVLRGTFPVPPGLFPRADGRSPFVVRDGAGGVARAQTEVVSWYAHDPEGADVVEVLARIAGGTQPPDGRARYDVLYYPHATAPNPGQPDPTDLALGPEVPPKVAELVTTPGLLQLYAEDVFGNAYLCDLLAGDGGIELRKYGETAAELRTYGVMRPLQPTPGPNGTLPHLFGVHAYVRTYLGEEVVGLDLRIHNGFDGHDTSSPLDDPLGDVYFRRLDLVTPAYWALQHSVKDPAVGLGKLIGQSIAWSLVGPLGSGDPHLLPHQAQFHRRLALAHPTMKQRARDLLEHRGLAFARPGELGGPELWSWWNGETARYFPQKHRLPRLDHLDPLALRADLTEDYEELEAMMVMGNGLGLYPVVSGAMGWAHPWGVPYGGMAGGAEIVFYDGIETLTSASTDGYRLSELVHRMHTDRQANVLYHADGNPTSPSYWLLQGAKGPYLPMNFYMGLLPGSFDPFGFEDAPTFQADHVSQNGLEPWYQDFLLHYEPHDLQHLVRYTRSAKAMVWLGNDSLARDDLRMQAELVRLTYHPWANSSGGYVLDGTMLHDIQHVAATPGVGLSIGRAEGWAVDTVATAYGLSRRQWRKQVRPWFDEFVSVVDQGISTCNGFLQSHASVKFFDYQYKARSSVEQAILEHALRDAVESVYRRSSQVQVDRLESVLVSSITAGVSPMAWSFELNGPWTVSAVAPLDPMAAPWCSLAEVPEDGHTDLIDNYQSWGSYAHAYELTQNPLFLLRAEQLIGGPLAATLIADGTKNLGTRSALIALVEELSGGS